MVIKIITFPTFRFDESRRRLSIFEVTISCVAELQCLELKFKIVDEMLLHHICFHNQVQISGCYDCLTRWIWNDFATRVLKFTNF